MDQAQRRLADAARKRAARAVASNNLQAIRALRDDYLRLARENEEATRSYNQSLRLRFTNQNTANRNLTDAFQSLARNQQLIGRLGTIYQTIANPNRTQSAALTQGYLTEVQGALAPVRAGIATFENRLERLREQNRREVRASEPPPDPLFRPRRRDVGAIGDAEAVHNRLFNFSTYTYIGIAPVVPLTGVRAADQESMHEMSNQIRLRIQRVLSANRPAGRAFYITLAGSLDWEGDIQYNSYGLDRNRFPNNVRGRAPLTSIDNARGNSAVGEQAPGLLVRPNEQRLALIIQAFVDDWLQQAVEATMNHAEQYDTHVRIQGFRTLEVCIKELIPAGQGYIVLRLPEGVATLWSPDEAHSTCLIDCLVRAFNLPPPSYNTLYLALGRSVMNAPLLLTEIPKVMTLLGLSDHRVVLHQFKQTAKGKTTLQWDRQFPKDPKATGQTAHLIFHLSHYVLWVGGPKSLPLPNPDWWQMRERKEKATEGIEDRVFEQENIRRTLDEPIPKHDTLLIHANHLNTWDLETYSAEGDKGRALPYIATLTTASAHFDTFLSHGERLLVIPVEDGRVSFKDIPRGEDKTMRWVGRDCVEQLLFYMRALATSARSHLRQQIDAIALQEGIVAEMMNGDTWNTDGNVLRPVYKDKTLNGHVHLLMKKYALHFWAHNSGRFDHFLLLQEGARHLLATRKNECGFINANGIIQMTLFDGFVVLKDSYRHFQAKLSKVCSDFSLPKEFSKGECPHDFITAETLDYVGPTPADHYWPGGKMPEELAGRTDWSIGTDVLPYAVRDTYALLLCLINYALAMNELTGLNPLDSLTIPGLAYKVIANALKFPEGKGASATEDAVYIVKDLTIDSFFRKSIRGGRSVVGKAKFISKQEQHVRKVFAPHPAEKAWAEWADEKRRQGERPRAEDYASINPTYAALHKARGEAHALCTDYLEDQDGVSLYPSVMATRLFPVGRGAWVPLHTLPSLASALNKGDHVLPCIVECSLTYPNKKDCWFPVLPHRRTSGSNIYSLTDADNDHIVVNSVDLEDAIRYNGAVVKELYHAFQWPKELPIFKEIMTRLFQARAVYKKQGKKALANCIKLLLNSAYGKLIQALIETSMEVYMPEDNERLDKAIYDGRVLGIKDFDNRLLVELKKTPQNRDVKQPSHLGSFVLAFARRQMNEVIEAMGGFKNLHHSVFYMDTDSLQVHTDAVKALEGKVNAEGNPFIGSSLGQFHSDLEEDAEDAKIIAGTFIASKLYHFVYCGRDPETGAWVLDEHKRSKGTTTKAITEEHYHQMLHGESHEVRDQLQFKRLLTEDPGIVKVSLPKTINRTLWEGKCAHPHPEFHHLWLPYGAVV